MNEIQISKETSNLIKGAACLLIVVHHFCSWLDGKGYNGFLIDLIGLRGGVIGVTLFFFLSAWGLSESQNKNQYPFILFAKRRLAKIYIPLIITNILFYFFWLYFKQNRFNLVSFLLTSLNLKFYDGALWFCNTILVFYILFYLAFMPNLKWARVLLCLFFTVLYSVVVTLLYPTKPFYVYGIIGFPFGMILSQYKKTIMKYEHWASWCCITMLFLIVGARLVSSFDNLFLMNIFSLIFLVILVVIIQKVNISKKLIILPFLGTYSYEIYLLHDKFLIPMGRTGYLLWYPLAFISLVLPMAILLNRYSKAIFDRWSNYQNQIYG